MNSQRGYTLVELIVCLGALALFVTIAVVVAHFIVKFW